LKRVLRSQIGKIVSTLELMKRDFLICKKCANVLCVCVFEMRIRVLKKMVAKKWLSLARFLIGGIR